MQTGQRIGTAGTASNEAHTGAPGDFRVGFGHHRCAALLAAHHQFYIGRIVQRIQHRQKALAGHDEDPIDPVSAQQFDDGLPTGWSLVIAGHLQLLKDNVAVTRAITSANRLLGSTYERLSASARLD
ncbi:hypothetical protein D3C85_1468870 [compost metagenome]